MNHPVLNDERNFDFDLEDERESLFHLNKIPANEEDFNNEGVEFPYDNDPNDYDEHIADTYRGLLYLIFVFSRLSLLFFSAHFISITNNIHILIYTVLFCLFWPLRVHVQMNMFSCVLFFFFSFHVFHVLICFTYSCVSMVMFFFLIVLMY